MMRRFLASFAVAMLAVVLVARADEPAKVKKDEKERPPASIQEEARLKQEILKRRFQELEIQLQQLSARLEKSSKKEERDQAQVIKDALNLVSKEGIDVRFDKLVTILQKSKANSLQEVKEAIDQADLLAKNLRTLLDILATENRDAQIKAEKDRIEKILKELNKVIRDQKIVRTKTERGDTDIKDLKDAQAKVTDNTQKVADAMGGKTAKDGGKDGKAGEKGTAKDAGKEGGKGGEANAKDNQGSKGAGKEGGKGKEGGDKAGDKGTGKEGPKDGDKGKEGGAKDGAKEGDDKGKEGAGKDGAKEGGDKGKEGAGKDGAKGGEGAGKEGGKGGDKGKEGDSKDSKGGKGGGEGSEGGGKGDGGESGGGDGGGKKPPQPQAPGKKQVEDAIGKQQEAEKILPKKDAAEPQDDAVKKLEEARAELEKLLKQLREEEIERLLAQLQQRCEYMLRLQKEVRDGTIALDRAIGETPDKKAKREHHQVAGALSTKEGEIYKEANKVIELLRSEGTAVAFLEVFQQVALDMKKVEVRLSKTDVGLLTVKIETDIINTLEEMIEALKKAQQDMKKQQGGGGGGGGGGNQANQKLIDMLAELKMIRNMQDRVYKRTQDIHKLFPETEQADNSDIQKDLKELAERQVKIHKITVDIYTKKNE